MPPIHVFFFRGLSTYDSDHAKWSAFDFGPVYKHLARAFAARGIAFHPVLGLGSGPIRQVAERGRAFIQSHPAWTAPRAKVHFLGHSAGGLVARLVLAEIDAAKVLSCATIASPHRGSELARICVDMPKNRPGSARLLRTLGYDVAGKAHFFNELTPDSVTGLLGTLPAIYPTVSLGSVVCWAPHRRWCPPLKMFRLVKAFRDFQTPSDGMIERDSQDFGRVIAELPLDHFREIGLFGPGMPFTMMIDELIRFWSTAQKESP